MCQAMKVPTRPICDVGTVTYQHSIRKRVVAIVLLYATWFRMSSQLPARLGSWGPRWLARMLSLVLSRALGWSGAPIRSLRTPQPPIDPSKQHLVVWHPHGAYTCMAFGHCANQSVTQTPLAWHAAVAPVLFKIPIMRELLLLFDARSVNAKVVDKLCASGATVGIQPGGVPEQLQTDCEREMAVFPPRLGFIRLAMRHGVPLLPAYIFGENQAYKTFGALGREVSRRVFKATGFPFVPVLGKWGLPWLVPRTGPIDIRWGQPVPVGPPNASPTDAEVEAVYDAYVSALRQLFDEHKNDCLPAEIAAKGLMVIKRPAITSAPSAAPNSQHALTSRSKL